MAKFLDLTTPIMTLKERKFNKEVNAELDCYGVTYKEGAFINSNPTEGRVFLCLVRALLLFMASFGTIGSMISSFGLKYMVLPVIAFSLFICVYISFIYYNKITFYVGYVIFFIGFVFSVFSAYWYVNSGFQAFINVMYEKYSDYFMLSTLREATEYITDRRLTISVMMMFAVTSLAMLLNITISGYMNMLLTFLLTFPLLQLGLYINCLPKPIYLLMVLSAYITVAILGRSSHYKLPDIGNSGNHFITTKRKSLHYHAYSSDGVSVLFTVIISCVFCSAFLLVVNSLFYSDLGSKHVTNKLKATTDTYLEAIIQNGLWAMFDRYESKGGLSQGKLGGVSSVRPDYETDLVLTFVPESTDNIYLKGYIGVNYGFNLFYDTSGLYDTYENTNPSIKNTYSISDYVPLDRPLSRMDIKNIDADRTYNLSPYYGVDITTPTLNEEDNSMEYTAYYETYEQLLNYSSEKVPDAAYEQYVHEIFMSENDLISESIDTFCEEADLLELGEQLKKASSNKEKQLITLQICSALRRYYVNEYSYTMAPGSTPRNRDFIEYFLLSQKRGFCAHFAASSTMVLRHLGIPARYVEGYMVTLSDMSDATAVSTDISDWVDESLLSENFETGVIELKVNDSSAHAWVEIYLDGYGWIPYEFTPPSDDEEILSDFSFGSLLSSLLMSGNSSASPSNNDDNTIMDTLPKFSFSIDQTLGFILLPLAIVLAVSILVLVICVNREYIVLSIRLKKYEKQQNYSMAIRQSFILFEKQIRKMYNLKKYPSVGELSNMLNMPGCDDFVDTINKALYSNIPISEEEYKAYNLFKQSVLKTITK